MINVFQPSVGKEELEAVEAVFNSKWLGPGLKVVEFEKSIAHRLRVEQDKVLSVSSCTAGLELIVRNCLHLSRHSEVIMPSISFVGSGNLVASAGAKIVFCDVDPVTLSVTLDGIAKCKSSRTRAVILLHYGGRPCRDIEAIAEYCQDYNIILIEDTAASPFAMLDGRNCGTFGDFGVWSFDATKTITTAGDGGLIYCKRPEYESLLRRLSYLGQSVPSGYANTISSRWWEFEVSCYGSRHIMNDVSAAVGLVQLSRLDSLLSRRREIRSFYDYNLKDLPGLSIPPSPEEEMFEDNYFYWVQFSSGELRDSMASCLRKSGIYTTFRYHPLHKMKAFEHKVLPNTELAAETTLLLPMHADLTEDDQSRICDLIVRKLK